MEYVQIESPYSVAFDGMVTPVERVFLNRGMTPDYFKKYMSASAADILSPLLFENMRQGAEMLLRHIKNKSDVFIQVDSDCDGYTSSAALINYLYKLFPSFVKEHITYRLHTGKQHGIILETVPENVSLVIVPDAGSNDFEQHKVLKERGCDVLVLDHHEIEGLSKDACIINNQIGGYPNRTLSGVGVVYKFCSYLDTLARTNYAHDILDLVALGMVGDMMDLRELETHYLIEQGLINIQNPFFSTMREVQSYSIDRAGGLCPFALSFYIVPLINAAIRVGEQEDKVLLFESMLDFKGWELIPSTKRGCKGQKELRAEQACRVCSSLKRLQTKQIDTMLPLIEQNISLENKIIVIEVPSSVNPNLRGLIANQLMAKYQQPVLMLSERIAEDGTRCLEGSGRGYEMRGFNDLRTFIEDSGCAYLASGHANAFGVGMTRENLDKFIEFSNAALANIKFSQCVKVDFIWGDYDFSAQDIIDIARLNAVWGQGMPEPQIALENVEVYPENVTLMSRNKNPTLKITLRNGVSLIKFKSSEEEYERLISSPNGVTITAIGTCALNEWNGRTSAQIKIRDYEIGCPILFRF